MKRSAVLAIILLLTALTVVAFALDSLPGSTTTTFIQLVRVRVNCIYKNQPASVMVSISEIDKQGNVIKTFPEKPAKSGRLMLAVPRDKSYRITAVEQKPATAGENPVEDALKASQDIYKVNASIIVNLELHDNALEVK